MVPISDPDSPPSSAPGASPGFEAGRPADAEDLILQRRHRLARRYASHEGGVLLDFGCGNGAQSRVFARHFDAVLGLDLSPVQLARFAEELRHDPAHSCLPVRYDGFRLPLPDAGVDQVISFEVLEHVASEEAALREIHRVLRPGGKLVLSVPNRWWLFETHGANLPLLPWNRVPFFSWLPKGLHDRWARARNYRQREIRELVARHGLTLRHSSYITAPLDVLPEGVLRRSLRSALFREDETRLPILATAILVVAQKID